MRREIKALATEPKIALKNILFATDFEPQTNRALPFAVAFTEHFGAKLVVAHVIPEAAYRFSRPDSLDRIRAESHDYARYRLGQIVGSLRFHDCTCEALVGEGDPGEVITEFAQTHRVDLIVIGTSSRAGVANTLVVPDEANASLGLISVLAPIGIALIGRRKGASIEAMVPGRIRRLLRILQVTEGSASSSRKQLPVRRQSHYLV